ncbi:MAG: hypothetical protein HKN57_12005 [Xanthomonadales bacterium]|nr:NAD-dependent epimerase/dehydratase family protein [Gammaproteobacteria bacterium]MBT8053556.1 NAD-dependent epimerase/dehydratase family protein [Gammaproteobacteria bacterium]NND57963.1 hypothetical protein [Xanthomonadales bacterium]NNK50871.1 hypothetical protein [Xanthomonadales bacterium]
MRSHYFFTSVTRCSDLWSQPFKTQKLDRSQWGTGDFVVGRATGERNRLWECETKTGRMADMVRGDLMVGALGRRAATLEGVGDWREALESRELEALTSAGLLGRATSISPMLPDLMRLEYLGHATRNGQKLGMMDFVLPARPAKLDIPVILIIGTSMSAGKTSSGQVIVRALNYLGLNVVATKLTGAARYRDILKFRDAGAREVFDFVDAGLPSTVCTEPVFRSALELMLSKIAACDADVLVAEAGASPLEPYNGGIVIEYLRDLTRFTVLCASDPYAVLGVQMAYGNGMKADLVSGPAANTTAAVSLVKELSGHRALSLLDRNTYPELVSLLTTALKQ